MNVDSTMRVAAFFVLGGLSSVSWSDVTYTVSGAGLTPAQQGLYVMTDTYVPSHAHTYKNNTVQIVCKGTASCVISNLSGPIWTKNHFLSKYVLYTAANQKGMARSLPLTCTKYPTQYSLPSSATGYTISLAVFFDVTERPTNCEFQLQAPAYSNNRLDAY